MAKAKSGGTRSYLRGRIANDVYSIGKDSKGKKQQVVRSLAETVANPQTVAQMRGRMIMSTVMQAVSALALIIDHSFDNVVAGQPSISEFIRQNYARIKDDVAANPASGNTFALNRYQEKGCAPGAYLISSGKGSDLYSFLYSAGSSAEFSLSFDEGDVTGALVKSAFQVGADGYVTCVFVTNSRKAYFFRVRFTSALTDDVVVTSENVSSLFTIEDPFDLGVTVSFASNSIKFGSTTSQKAIGLIGSYHDGNGGYIHTSSQLSVASNIGSAADVVLPTYPVGQERFLNGGDL